MPWARFDDRFPSHRKVRLLSDPAFRLFVSAVCWSSENLTDGVIATTELRLVSDVRSARKRVEELVDHGLWEVIPGAGWRIHDYLEYNPSADKVRADRKAKTARQQRYRDKQRGDGDDDDGDYVDASTAASRDASRDAAPSRPVPTRPVVGGSGGLETSGSWGSPHSETAAYPPLREGQLPPGDQPHHVPPEDPLPAVRTATIPVREPARPDLVNGRSISQLDHDRHQHIQSCGYCQQGPHMCRQGASLALSWALAGPAAHQAPDAPF